MRQPAWAEAAYEDYAKRFPAELRLELKAVKAEPRGSRTAAQLMAAEATRIEAALPKGARRIALDERGERVSSLQLAARLLDWQGRGGDAALIVGGPDGLDPAFRRLRRVAAPVRPDPAARLRPCLARGAVPRWSINASNPYHGNERAGFVYLASQSPDGASCSSRSAVRTRAPAGPEETPSR